MKTAKNIYSNHLRIFFAVFVYLKSLYFVRNAVVY